VFALFSAATRTHVLLLDDGWELRLFGQRSTRDFFRRHGIQHALLWHPKAAVSVFTPCLLWDHQWLVLDASGRHQFSQLSTLRAWLSIEHRIAAPSPSRLRALARWFSSPTTAPCSEPPETS
jgi:hypothetical protein